MGLSGKQGEHGLSLKDSLAEVCASHFKEEGIFTGFITALCLCLIFMMYAPELFEKYANAEVKDKLVEQSFTVYTLTRENEEYKKANERAWERIRTECQ